MAGKRRGMARMVALDQGLVSRAASTPQDDTSATCAEDLFTKCVSCRARGRRCAYPIVWRVLLQICGFMAQTHQATE